MHRVLALLAGLSLAAAMARADFGFVLETGSAWPEGSVRTLAFTPDGGRLVVGGERGGGVFAVGEGRIEPQGLLSGTRKEVLGAAVSPDGKTLALVDGAGSLLLYDASSLASLAAVSKAHAGKATAVAFTIDGAYVLTGGEDGKVKAWTPRGAPSAEVSKGSPHEGPVVFLAGLPPGRRALSVGRDGRMVLWQVDTQQAVRPSMVDMNVLSGSMGGAGEVLALGLQELRGNLHRSATHARAREIQADDRVRLIDLGSGAQLRDLEGEEQNLETVAVTPDGRFVASAGSGASASIWDAATGKLIARIPFEEPVSALTFSPDGRWLATGTEKGNLSLYRLSGVGPAVIQQPAGQILIIVLEPEAARGSTAPLRVETGSLRLRGKIKADKPLKSLEVDGEEITSLVADGEGNYLFTANVSLASSGRRQIDILVEDQQGTTARESVTVERTPEIRRPEPGPGHRLALLVGVSDYDDSSLDLEFADDDAKALYDLLTSPALGPAAFRKEDVMLLLDKDATKDNINIGLREFLQKARENDFVLFFFAGHGVPDPNRLSDLYLMAHDSFPNNVAGTGILMRHVREAIADIPARDVLILSDACHSAGIAAPKGARNLTVNPIHQVFLEKMLHSSGGLAILTASEAAQASLESSGSRHGVFTNYLLKGLQGEADTNRDRIVTLGEVMEYVRDNVKNETRGAQIPSIGPTSFDRFLPIAIVPER